MKKAAIIFLVSIAFNSLLVSNLFAKAESGFGIFGGLSNANISGTGSDTDFTGFDFGIDYQFAISDGFSLNLFAIQSSGDGDDVVLPPFTIEQELDLTIVGLQARFWFDNLFLGAQLSSVKPTLTVTIQPLGLSGSGSGGSGGGVGGVIGFESDGGFMIYVQHDIFSTDNAGGTSTDFTSTVFNVGFRFK